MDDLTLDKRTDGAVPARKPRDDVLRVDHLRQFCILDTGSDPRFDRITQLVSELLVMPIVLVSLVDEAREWFKSKVGTEIAEILRDHGFCSHALHLEGRDVLTIADTLSDARFATHPYVVGGPQLRFYAGAPLITASGHKIGMLCVHDMKPRPDFGVEHEHILSQFAGIVMDEIDFHRIESERAILIGELSHRVKNVFGVVQSVASLSGRGNPAAQPFLAVFTDRLAAMSSAHDRLITADWKEASLDDIVAGVVAAHQNVDKTTIVLDMAQLMIDPPFAQMLVLLVHELLTNSIKHGALKAASGRVAFTAQREQRDGIRTVRFVWRESGGPPVIVPEEQGFGHRLLDMVVRQKGGTVRLDWDPTGLVCRFVFFEQTLARL